MIIPQYFFSDLTTCLQKVLACWGPHAAPLRREHLKPEAGKFEERRVQGFREVGPESGDSIV